MKINIQLFGISGILLLVLPFFAFSAQNDPEAEYRKLSKIYRLNTDGSQEYRFSMELTLFTHTAMNRTYGESFIVYNPIYQELIIHHSFTKQKDGSIIQTPENAFVEVLPRQAADAPAFNHLKEMVVVHTGLELGATIYLDYSILTKPGYFPEIDICEPVRQTSMVKDYEIILSVPENKPLSYALTTINADPEIKNENGLKHIRWKLQHVKAASREPQTTGITGTISFFTATTYPSIHDAINILNQQFSYEENDILKTVTEKITGGKTNGNDKMIAVLKYISDNLSSIPVNLMETGFRIRPVGNILSSAYATEAEKVYLLAVLLRMAGLNTEVVAAFHPDMNVKNCGLAAIQELFVIANIDGKDYFLTPRQKKQAESAMFGEFVSFVNVTKSGESMDITPFNCDLDYHYTISLKPEKATLKVTGKVGRTFIPYTDDYLNLFTANDPDAHEKKENDYSIFTFSTTLPSTKITDQYLLYTLPDAANSMSHAAYKDYNSKRSERLLLPYKANESFIYTIEFPENMKFSMPGISKSITNPVGELYLSTTVNGNKIEIRRILKIRKQLIAPSDYAAFRQLMVEWADEKYRQLLFR